MNKKDILNKENDFFLATWMAGEITDEEMKKHMSSDDLLLYKKIMTSVNSLERPVVDIDASYQNFLKKRNTEISPSKVRKLIPNWAYAVAASLVLALGIYQFGLIKNKITTDFGEQHDIALYDGSTVKINAKSKLVYAKKRTFNRNVFLEGEGFFKITKGDKFDVETPQGVVSVLGTEFNIIARKDIFEVICYTGKVRVSYRGAEVVLTPGKAYRVLENKQPKQWSTVANTASWKSGVSNFKSIPIKFVLEAIQNEYNVSINATQIDDTKLFTGSFKHNDIEATIKSISLLLDVQYKIEGTEILLFN